MDIVYTPKFIKEYRKLPYSIKLLFERKEAFFKVDPHNPLLKTHKLIGRLDGYLAFSVNFHYRVIFRYKSTAEVYFVAIGGHEIYR
mgnify:CR=1 FL=1